MISWADLQTSLIPLKDRHIKNHYTESSHSWRRVRNSNYFECTRCKTVKIIDGNDTYTLGYDCDHAVDLNIMREAIGEK